MKIGIIGYGNMGQAIAQQLKNNYDIFVFDKDKAKLGSSERVNLAKDITELSDKCGVIILAVKPQDFTQVLPIIKEHAGHKLVISIAAGVTTAFIENQLGQARVIRVMPNMPARITEGMTCLAQGKFASLEDLDFAENLFDYLGETLEIEETMMNAATAISGSGPAYVCYFLETNKLDVKNIPEDKKSAFLGEFKSVAIVAGFNEEQAGLLVNTTFNGTISFLKRENITPEDLRKQVTSKGGTTEAALEVLDRGGSLAEAIKSAIARAGELSGRF